MILVKTFTITVKKTEGFKKFEVPVGLTILDALEYINKTYGENIQFRSSCKAGQCGSCAVMINKKSKLACKTKVEDNMIIEPLEGFDVISDLVVDREPYYKKIGTLRNYIQKRMKK